MLDPHREAIAAVLDEDAKVPPTVIVERLRREGYRGGITILVWVEHREMRGVGNRGRSLHPTQEEGNENVTYTLSNAL